MNKWQTFWHKYRESIKKLSIFLIACFLVSLLCFFILYGVGVISFEGGIQFNASLFESIKNEWYGYLYFFFLQVLFTTLLCFAPGGSSTFIALGVVLYGPTWQTFLLVFTGVIASSLAMDLLGRFGGAALIRKLFGEEDYNKGMKLIQEKGIVYLPFMYLFPVFPDDLLCCLAGMSKIKLWYHLLIITLCRGIGVATIVFGVSIVPIEQFTSLWDWIVAITVILFWVILAFLFARFLDKKLTAYLKKKTSSNQEANKEEEKNIEKDTLTK